VGPQYHTQPPAFDDQGYFYGAAGTITYRRSFYPKELLRWLFFTLGAA
jgi:hypothetical protein